jgi:hypothetical protein
MAGTFDNIKVKSKTDAKINPKKPKFSNYRGKKVVSDFNTAKINGEPFLEVLPPDLAAELAFHAQNEDQIKLSPRAAVALGKINKGIGLRGAQSIIDLVDDARRRIKGYDSERFDWGMEDWHKNTRSELQQVRDARDLEYKKLDVGKGAISFMNDDASGGDIISVQLKKNKNGDYIKDRRTGKPLIFDHPTVLKKTGRELYNKSLNEAYKELYNQYFGESDPYVVGDAVLSGDADLAALLEQFETMEYPGHYTDESIADKMAALPYGERLNPDVSDLEKNFIEKDAVTAPINDRITAATGGSSAANFDSDDNSKAQRGKAKVKQLRGGAEAARRAFYNDVVSSGGSSRFNPDLAGLDGISYLWMPFVDKSGIHTPMAYNALESLENLSFLTDPQSPYIHDLLARVTGGGANITSPTVLEKQNRLKALFDLAKASATQSGKGSSPNFNEIAASLPVSQSSSFVLNPYADINAEVSLIGDWFNKNKNIFNFLGAVRDFYGGLAPDDFPVLPFPVNLYDSYIQGLKRKDKSQELIDNEAAAKKISLNGSRKKGQNAKGSSDVFYGTEDEFRDHVNSLAESLGVPSKFDSPRAAYDTLISRLAQKYPFAFDRVTGTPLFRAQFSTHSTPIGILDATKSRDASISSEIKNGDLPFNLYQAIAPAYAGSYRYSKPPFRSEFTTPAGFVGPEQYDALSALRNVFFYDYPEGGAPGFIDRSHAILNDVVNLSQVLGGELKHGYQRAYYSDDPSVVAGADAAGLSDLSKAFLKMKTIDDARSVLEGHMNRANAFTKELYNQKLQDAISRGLADSVEPYKPRFGSLDSAYGADDYLNAIRDILALSQIYRNINPALSR